MRQELAYLRRYCKNIAELQHELHSLQRFSHSVEYCYSGDTSKEMFLKAYKMGRGEADRRGRTQTRFTELMDDELARRGHQP